MKLHRLLFSVTDKYRCKTYGDERKFVVQCLFKSKYELLLILSKKDMAKCLEELDKLISILEDEDAYEWLFDLYYHFFLKNASLDKSLRQQYAKWIPEEKYIMVPEKINFYEMCLEIIELDPETTYAFNTFTKMSIKAKEIFDQSSVYSSDFKIYNKALMLILENQATNAFGKGLIEVMMSCLLYFAEVKNEKKCAFVDSITDPQI